jgi:single-stranded DNA-binding protein
MEVLPTLRKTGRFEVQGAPALLQQIGDMLRGRGASKKRQLNRIVAHRDGSFSFRLGRCRPSGGSQKRPAAANNFSQSESTMTSTLYLHGKISGNHEIKRTKKDALWLKLFLEVELVRSDGRGGVKTESTVVPISCFSHEAEAVKDLRPGERLIVGCHLQGTEFTSPDGSTRRGVQLTADSIHVSPPRKENL